MCKIRNLVVRSRGPHMSIFLSFNFDLCWVEAEHSHASPPTQHLCTYILPVFVQAALWQSAHSAYYAKCVVSPLARGNTFLGELAHQQLTWTFCTDMYSSWNTFKLIGSPKTWLGLGRIHSPSSSRGSFVAGRLLKLSMRKLFVQSFGSYWSASVVAMPYQSPSFHHKYSIASLDLTSDSLEQ